MINVILAVDKNFGIGNKGQLPWHIPSELRLFKAKTLGSIVIVGRQTFQTLPPLPDRTIFVVSRSRWVPHKGELVPTFSSFEDALQCAELKGLPIFVIGGNALYKYVLNNYKTRVRVHISLIEDEFECDTYFDRYLLNDFYTENETEYLKIDTKKLLLTHKVLSYKKFGEQQYINLVSKIIAFGDERLTRSGITKSIFGEHLKFDLREGYPLLTTKKMFTRGVIEELLFFLRGETDTKNLEKKGVNIWKGNTSREFLDKSGFTGRKEGLMGPLYSTQWRNFNGFYDENTGLSAGGIDQIQEVVDLIKKDPGSRRILLTSYNPGQAKQAVLYCCHSVIIQFYCGNPETLEEKEYDEFPYLDMFCYNRSSDVGLGLPFNIASSALLLSIIAKLTNKQPRFMHISLGDAHIYNEHEDVLKSSLNRIPYKFPSIEIPNWLSSVDDISELRPSDFIISEYDYYPTLKMEMNV